MAEAGRWEGWGPVVPLEKVYKRGAVARARASASIIESGVRLSLYSPALREDLIKNSRGSSVQGGDLFLARGFFFFVLRWFN